MRKEFKLKLLYNKEFNWNIYKINLNKIIEYYYLIIKILIKVNYFNSICLINLNFFIRV